MPKRSRQYLSRPAGSASASTRTTISGSATRRVPRHVRRRPVSTATERPEDPQLAQLVAIRGQPREILDSTPPSNSLSPSESRTRLQGNLRGGTMHRLGGILSDAQMTPEMAFERQQQLFAEAAQRHQAHRLIAAPVGTAALASEHPAPSRVPEVPSGTLRSLNDMMDVLRRTEQSLRVLMQRRVAERAAERRDACGGGDNSGADDGGECPICFDKLEIPSTVISHCGHVFHMQCILQHIEQRGSRAQCPICRRAMHRAELIAVMNGLPEKTSEGGAVEGGLLSKFSESVKKDEDEIVDLTGDGTPKVKIGASPRGTGGSSESDGGVMLDRCIIEALNDMRLATDRGGALKELEAGLRAATSNAETELDMARKKGEEERARIVGEVRRERQAVTRAKANLESEQEAVRLRVTELNEEIALYKKKNHDLELETKKIDVKLAEYNEKKEKQIEEEFALRRREERLRLLGKQMGDVGEREGMEGVCRELQIARSENKALKVRIRRLERLEDQAGCQDQQSDEEDVVGAANAMYEARRGKKRLASGAEKGTGVGGKGGCDLLVDGGLLFEGDKLQKPSEVNRPVAPRRLLGKRVGVGPSGGLTGFVAERRGVQRPSAKVGGKIGTVSSNGAQRSRNGYMAGGKTQRVLSAHWGLSKKR